MPMPHEPDITVDIPAQTITRFIDGSRAIDKANGAKLAKYFHVSPDLLLPAG